MTEQLTCVHMFEETLRGGSGCSLELSPLLPKEKEQGWHSEIASAVTASKCLKKYLEVAAS